MSERELFIAAMQITEPAQRTAWLDRQCGDDAALRQRIDKLLQAFDNAGSLLETPAVASSPTSDEPITEVTGTVIGPYKLLQQIGEGGMGVVWMAEQTQPVQRKVALKVIAPSMDSRQVIARFEAERRALAMMDHVNIARVFDGGTTENGRPYFVMELVHGVPITKYCDDNHLTPRERLELFVPVCQAIQHAHQKGIIHRDIKPSNVMVTLYDGKPVPKVIDFGVAKATEQKLTERTLFTQYGTMIGTLEYMSPEQAEMSALGVDTRSDIYSLGVLLYELLTGSTPLRHKRFKEAAFADILRMIKEEEPPKPSTRLSESGDALVTISAQRHMEPAKLTKLMRGELDWIVMKTLEKDRNRRYETASGFAADVERYLNDEQVLACPPSASYRFSKFARRNRRTLATGLLVVATLLLAVVGLAISNTLIEREQTRTKSANTRLNANQLLAMATLDDVYMKVGEWSLHDPQRKKEYQELLVRVLGSYQQLAEHGTDPQVRVRLAYFHVRFANLLLTGDDRATSAEHYHRALDLQTKVVADVPDVAAFQERLAYIHFHLADLQTRTGQSQEAAEHYRLGFQIVEELVSKWPSDLAYSGCLAWNRATCLDPKFRDLEQAVLVGEKAATKYPSTWTYVGIAHYRAGDQPKAIAALKKAMVNGGDSTDWLFLAMAHSKLGEKLQAGKWYDHARISGWLNNRPASGPRGFPIRFASFRDEAAALLEIDRDKEARDSIKVPAKN